MKLEEVKKIGVLGGGVMGGGITQTILMAGFNVTCRDLKDEILAKTRENILSGRFGLKGGIERGKYTQAEVDEAMKRLTLTTRLEDLKDCDLVVEAIGGGPSGEMENKDLKLRIFKELDGAIKKEAILASNTSFFTIADLAAVTNRKERVIGMHWFSPANIMKAVEVIWTADNSPETIQTIEGLCLKLKKTPIRVKDVPGDTGFIGNRIFKVIGQEAYKIVQEGIATADDVDTVMMLGFNWPAGPIGMGRGAKAGWGEKK